MKLIFQKIIKIVLLVMFLLIGLFELKNLQVFAQSGDPVIAGAGDISPRSNGPQFQTANLLDSINPAFVLTFGDNQYPDGILADFNTYYHPSWGRFKSRTRPSTGNHDYHTPGGAGYFDYFNGVGVNSGVAGDRSKGYYSYNVGSWHLIALNSEAMSSTQNAWLAADLQANQGTACTLAYWHEPRFSSGAVHGSNNRSVPFWDLLYQYKADVVLNGHDHLYERFAPQNPSGGSDPTNGIREFIAGTGGAGLYAFGSPIANSQFRVSTHGVLKLTLHQTSYDWQFININSQVLDSGSGNCVMGSAVTSTPGSGPTSTRTPTPPNLPSPTRTRTPTPTLPGVPSPTRTRTPTQSVVSPTQIVGSPTPTGNICTYFKN
ncbi:hypothetical protein A2768_01895 [Candidatus Roizmanbacteria bacterium RIFCSPHIGHO2_01_FULL_37_16]|nr:MAG: hypothetical protein A2768_01895 [Candidatus Roizmanbacteria bacterium RIFCSPHIGHO2_01_FULL_37_16]